MDLFDIMWEIHQEHEFSNARSDISIARTKSSSTKDEIKCLQQKFEKLSITCQALWELVKDKTDLTDDMIIAKIEEIDLRDGVDDGKETATAIVCSKCGRKTNSRRDLCMYCGAKLGKKEIF